MQRNSPVFSHSLCEPGVRRGQQIWCQSAQSIRFVFLISDCVLLNSVCMKLNRTFVFLHQYMQCLLCTAFLFVCLEHIREEKYQLKYCGSVESSTL